MTRARRIIEVRERYLRAAAAMGTPNGLAVVDLICENPLATTKLVEERLGVSRPTALRLLRQLEERGVLSQGDAGKRGQRRYVARGMLRVVIDER
jgi:predicted HTH transcriptional regulator